MKKIYRIEIPSSFQEDLVFTFWIGKDLQLVSTLSEAIPVTEEEHLFTMSNINIPAVAYEEKGGVL